MEHRPKFTVAMVRAPGLSPYHARFLVPLDFSKYDLRDYLFHAYNVKCFNIRSYVKQMPVRDLQSQPNHWFREDSKKYMTVEMEQPFVWPELPADGAPWGIGRMKSEVDSVAEANGIVTMKQKREKAQSLREHVKALLTKKDSTMDKAIAQKRREGKELTSEELQKEAELKKMSALKFWEQKRNMKIVQGDESSQYTIKA